MTRRFHAERLNVLFGIMVVAILMGAITISVSSDPVEDGTVDIGTFVTSTFDGVGYADRAGEDSTIESTLNALKLLETYNLLENELFEWQYQLIALNLRTMQDAGGGFRRNLSQERPDIRTTAQCLWILQKTGQLDEHTRYGAAVYVAQFTKPGPIIQQTPSNVFDEWITDGVFESKYWALSAAVALGNPSHYWGLQNLDLGDVSLGESDNVNGLLKWNEIKFSSDSSVDPFDSMSQDEQLRV
ncbi:MAG: hypothetical protein ACTSR9_19360, partial [Candidatus Thorarchaeota archaeon]